MKLNDLHDEFTVSTLARLHDNGFGVSTVGAGDWAIEAVETWNRNHQHNHEASYPCRLPLCLDEPLSPTLQKLIGSTGWQFNLIPDAT